MIETFERKWNDFKKHNFTLLNVLIISLKLKKFIWSFTSKLSLKLHTVVQTRICQSVKEP
jgi:hypothetical protein